MGDGMGGRAVVARERCPAAKGLHAREGALRAASPEAAFLGLQRDAGNRAVARLFSADGPVIRRACACSGHAGGGKPCAGCAGHEEDEERVLHRSPSRAPGGRTAPDTRLSADVRSYLGRSRRSGRPLDPGARRQLESSFGRGLGGVRVHTGPAAAWAARSVRARAFALGRDIWFGSGEYRPGVPEGRRLLAHEVAHTLDQRDPVSLESVRVGSTDHPVEAWADRAAEAAVRRGRAPASGPQAETEVRRTPVAEAEVRRTPVAETVVRGAPTGESVLRRAPDDEEESDVRRGRGPGTSAAFPPWASCERPSRIRHGPGKGRERPSSALRFLTSRVLGVRFWELYNFDVDRSFVKSEHEAYVRDDMALPLKELIEDDNAFVIVVGEASTTAPQAHNLRLSKRRAACVSGVLRRELRRVGVTDLSRVLPPTGIGEVLSRVRRLGLDEIEDEEDRSVTIVAVREQECSEAVRTRRSELFRVKVACESPVSVAINIGDVSDPLQPTFRRFRWLHGQLPNGCRFTAAEKDAMFGARTDFRLATKDPDDPTARSDFDGEAILNPVLQFLSGAKGLYSIKVEGTWDPASCETTVGEIQGVITPLGPVECGEVPAPPKGLCKPDEEACSDTDKLASATKFAAILTRVGSDVSNLPWIGKYLKKLPITPEVGAAAVTIGTLDGPGPRLTRAFAFAYGGLGGTGGGVDKQVAVEKEATSARPLRLATRDPSAFLSPSDFEAGVRSPAKLVIKGGHTSTEELHVGGMTFTFSGQFCNHGGGRTLYGTFDGVSPVWCFDIANLTPYEPSPDCEEECPEDLQLAGHDTFTFRVGRATLSSLPVIGRRLADAYGCEIVAAFLNIGAEPDAAAEKIHREFLLVARRQQCRFDVAKRTWQEDFFLSRQLSLDDPEDRFDLSHFSGGAKLNDAGELTVVPAAFATPFTIRLPGAYDAACTGGRGAVGVIVPLADVQCGPVPEPLHGAGVDRDDLERCRDYMAANPFVAHQVALLKSGFWDPYIDLVTHPPGLVYPEIDDVPGWQGQVIPDARLVGRSGIAGFPKVVTFVDMEIINHGRDVLTGRLWARVKFVSDPCSFDEDGNPVMVRPRDCIETLPRNGVEDVIRSLPVRPRKRDEPEEEEKKEEEEVFTA